MTSTSRFISEDSGSPRGLTKRISSESNSTASTMSMSDYGDYLSVTSEPTALATGGRRRERYEREYDRTYVPNNPSRMPKGRPAGHRPESPKCVSDGVPQRSSRSARIASSNKTQDPVLTRINERRRQATPSRSSSFDDTSTPPLAPFAGSNAQAPFARQSSNGSGAHKPYVISKPSPYARQTSAGSKTASSGPVAGADAATREPSQIVINNNRRRSTNTYIPSNEGRRPAARCKLRRNHTYNDYPTTKRSTGMSDSSRNNSRSPLRMQDSSNASVGSRRSQNTEGNITISTHNSASEPPKLVSTNSIHSSNTVSTMGSSNSSSAPRQETTYVEIEPGVNAPLRRTEETMDAISHNYVRKTACLACTTELYCIADAMYYICPICRVISPLLLPDEDLPPAGTHIHGIGLGFTRDTLVESRNM